MAFSDYNNPHAPRAPVKKDGDDAMRRMAESLRHAGSSKDAQSSVIGQPITKNNGGGGEWLMEAFLSQASNRKSPERTVDVGRGDADRMVTSRAIQQSQERIPTSS